VPFFDSEIYFQITLEYTKEYFFLQAFFVTTMIEEFDVPRKFFKAIIYNVPNFNTLLAVGTKEAAWKQIFRDFFRHHPLCFCVLNSQGPLISIHCHSLVMILYFA